MDIKKEIEELYRIDIIDLEPVSRVQPNRIPCYKIVANEGIFFLKTYDEEVTYLTIKNFDLLEFLISKEYPAIKPFKSKRGNWVEVIYNTPVALFEWTDGEVIENPTGEEVYELGKYLGMLHKITENYEHPEPSKGLSFIKNNLMDLIQHKYLLREEAPGWYLELLDKLLEKLLNWKIPNNIHKSVIHEEFTFMHVLFKDGKVSKVIDWDNARRAYSFQDIALPLFDIITTDEKLVEKFLEGYEKYRPLSKWEKENLQNILLFGASIHFAWTTYEIMDGYKSWKDINKEWIERLLEDRLKFNI